MERNTSYGHQTPLNRSFQPGQIRPNTLHPLSPEEPVSGSSLWKWLLFILLSVGAVAAYQNRHFFVWPSRGSNDGEAPSTGQVADQGKEKDRATRKTTVDFSCNDLERLKRALREQSLTVKSTLPTLPTLASQQKLAGQVLSTPEQLETALGSLGQLNFDDIFDLFNELVPLSKVFQNSSKDQIAKPEKDLEQLREGLRPAEKFQKTDHVHSFALASNDLLGSYENLLSKRERLSKYRAHLIEATSLLPDCHKKRDDLQLRLSSFIEQDGKLRSAIDALQGQINSAKAGLNDLTGAHKDAATKAGLEITALSARMSDVRSKLAGRPKSEADIAGKKAELAKQLSKIADLTGQSEQSRAGMVELRSKLAANQRRIDEERGRLNGLETKQKMVELFLQLHYRNKSIKDFLEKLVDTSDRTASDFQRLLNEKLEEEDSIKTFIDEFFKNIKTLEGGGSDVNVGELDRIIEQDKAELRDVMSKYAAMVKIIKEYKDTDIQIQLLLKRQEEITRDISTAQNTIEALLRENKAIDRQLADLDNLIERNARVAAGLAAENLKLEEAVKSLEVDLRALEHDLLKLQDQLTAKQEKLAVS